jgi:dTDP-L-rhamnose 4-epimerase
MSKKVLISGGAGFIGSRLAVALDSAGHDVTVLDNLSPQIHGVDPKASVLVKSLEGRARLVAGDVRCREDWERAMVGQEVIVHLAAETGTGQSMYEIAKYTEVNITGTALMLETLQKSAARAEKVIVASSRAIYGEGKYRCAQHGTVYPSARLEKDLVTGDFMVKCPFCGQAAGALPTDEDSLIHPISIYGMTKHDQERMVHSVCASMGIPSVAFRYQNVYGPGQSLKNPYTGILSIFSTRILNGNPVNIFEDGEESRDFVYIDDVVHATMSAVEKPQAGQESLNVGSGEPVTVREVASTLREMYGKDVEIAVSGNFRLGDIRTNYADVSKAQRVLGFRPKTSFRDGISAFADWVKAQDVEKDNFEASMDELRRMGLAK